MSAEKNRQWLIELRGHLTQQEVADSAGMSRSYYAELESGGKNPSVVTAKKLGLVMGFDWTIFFSPNVAKSNQVI